MTSTIPVPDQLTVYGADWCVDCHRTRRYLDRAGITYRYVDLRQDAAAQAMLTAAGYLAIPIVATPGGNLLIEPSDRELAAALDSEAA